jgi:hypothetical protein
MKNLIILILLMVTYVSRGQDFVIYKEEGKIELAYQSFKLKALSRGLDMDSLINNKTMNGFPVYYLGIQKVQVLADPNDVAIMDFETYPRFYTATIKIHRLFCTDYNIISNTIAHEMGHLFQLKHKPRRSLEIMARDQPVISLSRLYETIYNPIINKARWDLFFEKVKHSTIYTL